MRVVLIYSVLLLAGLVGSQVVPRMMGGDELRAYGHAVRWATMIALAFIMIRVGHEFDIDKKRLGGYGRDLFVATGAAVVPAALCALYFMLVVLPGSARASGGAWIESSLAAMFSAATSAGVLFAMLAAAGLAATWVFRQARVLAVFDDLVAVLLLIPLKAVVVGPRWQLGATMGVMLALVWIAWRWLHALKLGTGARITLVYAALVVLACEGLAYVTHFIDAANPVHIEVLLPAFVLGCVTMHVHQHAAHTTGGAPIHPKTDQEHDDGEEPRIERWIAAGVSGAFMVLVGLSMPEFFSQVGAGTGAPSVAADEPLKLGEHLRAFAPAMGWGEIGLHVLAVTALSNLGKMVPALFYRRDASARERLALALAMWPRGEVGAGVLTVAIGYGIGGPVIVIALLSLAVNLLLTGGVIVGVKGMLAKRD